MAEKLRKPNIRLFEKRKVYSSFKDNVWSVDLADMQLISKYNKEIRFILCLIYVFRKNAFGLPFKDQKGITSTDGFQNFYR